MDTLASEIGIVLWAGLLRPTRVEGAVAGLERVATPWGLRTVSADHARFDPYAYHYGAIWPFENWFAWSGLRMPECYAVEAPGSAPTILPQANRTQAWTAGAVWALAAGWDGRPGMLH